MIGINRIETRNSINKTVAAELCSLIERFESDPEVDVAVLYGVGGSFSSGYDLNEIYKDGFTGYMMNKVS